ncbi:MAG: hypothetical protein RI894_1605 [Bacteroidota bacterium]
MATTQSIPKSLIYEISNGKPIYYKNYYAKNSNNHNT